MKWYSSFDYRPEADAIILVQYDSDIYTEDGSWFYLKQESYPDEEIVWRYAIGYKDREPIKVEDGA
jgi:hypothetical protein